MRCGELRRRAVEPHEARPGHRRPGAGTAASSPCVYGCSGACSTRAAGPDSTIRPAYMTATSSAIRLTTPMSCVISTQREPEPHLQLGQHVEHLVLHRRVERGGRLVGDQHARLSGQRAGDHRALQHAAGAARAGRRGPRARVGQPDQLEQLDARTRPPRGRSADLLADAPQRVEGARRVLEDDTELAAEHRARRRRASATPRRPRSRPAGSSPSGASVLTVLPRPALPHDRERAPGLDRPRDVVDGVHDAGARDRGGR